MQRHRTPRLSMLLALLSLATLPTTISAVNPEQRASWGIDADAIAPLITPAVAANRYPSHLSASQLQLPDLDGDQLAVRYTIDTALQEEAQRLLRKHNPDYGALVALDPDTGRILAMASSSRHVDPGNMALINDYPAASISKIITAVAAVNEGKVEAGSVVPFNGKSTSLYKNSVFAHRDTKWTRRYTFAKSFARSVNSVFGRVGAVDVGGAAMLDYAQQLGFNRKFDSDLDFDNGAVELDPNDRWQVAEMASGYTTRNTLSPLHAAALAAAAVNGGHLIAPSVVDSILGPNGVPLYWHTPAKSQVMRADTARALREMMRATVAVGSSRRSFARFHHGHLKDAVVGGKTGSLTGFAPRGKYDWFVGFGELDGRKIAFAALCINKQRWYVKSARLARELIEFHFRQHRQTPGAA